MNANAGKTSLIRQLVGEELKFEPEVKCEAELETLRQRVAATWLAELDEHERELERVIEGRRLAALLASQIELQQLLLKQQQKQHEQQQQRNKSASESGANRRPQRHSEAAAPAEEMEKADYCRQLSARPDHASEFKAAGQLLDHPTILISASSTSSLSQQPTGDQVARPACKPAEPGTDSSPKVDEQTTCPPQLEIPNAINQPLQRACARPTSAQDQSAAAGGGGVGGELFTRARSTTGKRDANHVPQSSAGADCDTPAASRQTLKQMRSLEVGANESHKATSSKRTACDFNSGGEQTTGDSGSLTRGSAGQQHRHSYCAPFDPSALSGKKEQLSKQAKIINILFSSSNKSSPIESATPGNKPPLMPALLRQYQRRLSNFHTASTSAESAAANKTAKKATNEQQRLAKDACDSQTSGQQLQRLSDLVKERRRLASLATEAARAAGSLATSAASAAQALMSRSQLAEESTVHAGGTSSLFATAALVAGAHDQTSEQVNLYALTEEYRLKLATCSLPKPSQTLETQVGAQPSGQERRLSPLRDFRLLANAGRRQLKIEHFCANFIDNMNLYELRIVDMPAIEPSREFPTSSLLEWTLFKGRSHLLTADAYLLVFDLTRPSTIQYIKMLRDKIFESREMSRVPVYVIANKADLCPTLQPSLQARQMRNIAVRHHQASLSSNNPTGGQPGGDSKMSPGQSGAPTAKGTTRRPSRGRWRLLAGGHGPKHQPPTNFSLAGEQRSVPAAAAHQLLAAYKMHRMRLGSSGPIVSLRRWAKLRRAVALNEPQSLGGQPALGVFYSSLGVPASAASHFERKRMHYSLILGASSGGAGGKEAHPFGSLGAAMGRCVRSCLRRSWRLLQIRSGARATRRGRLANRKRWRHRRRWPRTRASKIGENEYEQEDEEALALERGAAVAKRSRTDDSHLSIDRTESALIRGAQRRKSSVLAGVYQFNWQQQQQQQQRGQRTDEKAHMKEHKRRARRNKKERRRRKKLIKLRFVRAKKAAKRQARSKKKRRQKCRQQERKRRDWTSWWAHFSRSASSTSSGIERDAGSSTGAGELAQFGTTGTRKRNQQRSRTRTIVSNLVGWRVSEQRKRPESATAICTDQVDQASDGSRAARAQGGQHKMEAAAAVEQVACANRQAQVAQCARLVAPTCGAMSTPASRQTFYELFNRLLQTSSTMAAKTQLKLNAALSARPSDEQPPSGGGHSQTDQQNRRTSGKENETARDGQPVAAKWLATGPDLLQAAERKPKRRKSSSTGAALWQTLSSLALSRIQSASERKNSQSSRASNAPEEPNKLADKPPTNPILSDGLKLGTDQYLSADMLRKLSLISSYSQVSAAALLSETANATNETNGLNGDELASAERLEAASKRAKSAPDEQQSSSSAAASGGVASALRRASRIWLGGVAGGNQPARRQRTTADENDENDENGEGQQAHEDGSWRRERAQTSDPARGARRFWYRGVVKKILFHSNKQSLKGIVTAMELQRRLDQEEGERAPPVEIEEPHAESSGKPTNETADQQHQLTAQVHAGQSREPSSNLAAPGAPSIRIIASGSLLSLVSESHEPGATSGRQSAQQEALVEMVEANKEEEQRSASVASLSANSVSSVSLSESITLNIEGAKEAPATSEVVKKANLRAWRAKDNDDTDNSELSNQETSEPEDEEEKEEAEEEEEEEEEVEVEVDEDVDVDVDDEVEEEDADEDDDSSKLDALCEPQVSYQLRKLSADDCLIINRHRRQSLAALQSEQESLLKKFRQTSEQADETKTDETKADEMKPADSSAPVVLKEDSSDKQEEEAPQVMPRGEEGRRQSIKQSIEAAIHLLVPRAKARSASITLGASDCERRSRSQLGTTIMGAVNVHKTWRDWRQLLGRKKSVATAATATVIGTNQARVCLEGDHFGLLDSATGGFSGALGSFGAATGGEGGLASTPAPIVGFLSSHVAYKKLSADKQLEAAINFDQLMRINQLTLTAANVVMLAASQPSGAAALAATVASPSSSSAATATVAAAAAAAAAAVAGSAPASHAHQPTSMSGKRQRRQHRERAGELRSPLGGSGSRGRPTEQANGDDETGRPQSSASRLTESGDAPVQPLIRAQAARAKKVRASGSDQLMGGATCRRQEAAANWGGQLQASPDSRPTSKLVPDDSTGGGVAGAAAAAAAAATSTQAPPGEGDISAQIAAAAAGALERQRRRGEKISLILEPRFDKKQPGAEYPLFVSHDMNPILKDLAQLVRKHWKCNYIECSAASNWNIRPIISELTRALECNQRFKSAGGPTATSSRRWDSLDDDAAAINDDDGDQSADEELTSEDEPSIWSADSSAEGSSRAWSSSASEDDEKFASSGSATPGANNGPAYYSSSDSSDKRHRSDHFDTSRGAPIASQPPSPPIDNIDGQINERRAPSGARRARTTKSGQPATKCSIM